MELEKLLKHVAAKFDKLEIPYAITGALGSSFYGQPRTTHDFDIVVHLIAEKGKSKQIIKEFANDFYVSEEAIIDSLIHQTMFNIIHHDTGIKIDCWILKNDSFSRESFKRRKKENFSGSSLFFLSPEDLILNKLLWYKESDSEKQLKDIRGILEMQKIDANYINKWAAKLKVADILKQFKPHS
ncbi:MAG: hypothetical protein FD145_358 [Candidatus Saganbacteria bacterium]|uniref:Uncharacterized protein n=1 Tax=Candidatus Saganbacteria bacterium TaxID=2575572 RepID=A0A833NZ23_UNCSA|nr:MAG: hypothetical protein FD145_358 [Candidatus Saganbacteria bacterium]